ncbi:MAG: SAM-dependent methyltransferase [Desulfotomaculum sp.]|nr:SAM-dependent methyltransferase [Desulfotomaculum sp.]MCL0081106.1 SAM-dependent methyltransferase [Peptococcaceae bacterium]
MLDIKPYVPAFDVPADIVRVGWLAKKADQAHQAKSDERFK